MRYTLSERRQWFEYVVQHVERGVVPTPRLGVRYPCPCCGCPTLEERSHYEICDLRSWEDDGQDDPQADEVWGGPNYDLSLAQARQNFELYLDKYPPDQANYFGGPDNATELMAKAGMVAAFDDMIGQTDPLILDASWERVYRCQATLMVELTRKLSPRDRRHLKRSENPTRRPE